jgi:hypothetical protein
VSVVVDVFTTVIKLHLWLREAIFQSKNYKNVGGRFLLFLFFIRHENGFFFLQLNPPNAKKYSFEACLIN